MHFTSVTTTVQVLYKGLKALKLGGNYLSEHLSSGIVVWENPTRK